MDGACPSFSINRMPDFPALPGYPRAKIWITYKNARGQVHQSRGLAPMPFVGPDVLHVLKRAYALGYRVLAIWVVDPEKRALAIELLREIQRKHAEGELNEAGEAD